MRTTTERPNRAQTEEATIRASISFPSELYSTLEEIARQKKVSLAWVVRDAAEKYIEEKWPLFMKERRSL